MVLGHFSESLPLPARPAMAPMGMYEALEVLGFYGTPSGDVVTQMKAAYRRLAARLHPDKGGDAAAMQRLNQARDALANLGFFGPERDPLARAGAEARERAGQERTRAAEEARRREEEEVRLREEAAAKETARRQRASQAAAQRRQTKAAQKAAEAARKAAEKGCRAP